MLDIKFIRENKDLVAKAARDKNFRVDLDALLSKDEELRGKQSEMEALQAERDQSEAARAEFEARQQQIVEFSVGAIGCARRVHDKALIAIAVLDFSCRSGRKVAAVIDIDRAEAVSAM
jgi:hypothetical protein